MVRYDRIESYDYPYTAEQIANAPSLEPAFEHLLRNSSAHESVIHTLRVNSITDREDLGFDLSCGGVPHKREFAHQVRTRCPSVQDGQSHG